MVRPRRSSNAERMPALASLEMPRALSSALISSLFKVTELAVFRLVNTAARAFSASEADPDSAAEESSCASSRLCAPASLPDREESCAPSALDSSVLSPLRALRAAFMSMSSVAPPAVLPASFTAFSTLAGTPSLRIASTMLSTSAGVRRASCGAKGETSSGTGL